MVVQFDVSHAPEGSFVIDCGGENLTKYSPSGLDYIYVKGFVENHKTLEDWFRFNSIKAIHKEIASYINSKEGLLTFHEFDFLRKELKLTLKQFSESSGCNYAEIVNWRNGQTFSNETACKFIKFLYISAEAQEKEIMCA